MGEIKSKPSSKKKHDSRGLRYKPLFSINFFFPHKQCYLPYFLHINCAFRKTKHIYYRKMIFFMIIFFIILSIIFLMIFYFFNFLFLIFQNYLKRCHFILKKIIKIQQSKYHYRIIFQILTSFICIRTTFLNHLNSATILSKSILKNVIYKTVNIWKVQVVTSVTPLVLLDSCVGLNTKLSFTG